MTANPSKADLLRALGDYFDRLTYSPLFSKYFAWGYVPARASKQTSDHVEP